MSTKTPCAGINIGYGHLKLSTPNGLLVTASAVAPANPLYDGIGRARDTCKIVLDGNEYEVGAEASCSPVSRRPPACRCQNGCPPCATGSSRSWSRTVCRPSQTYGTWLSAFLSAITGIPSTALQGLVDPEEHLELDGLSDSAWRERIGNAVPPPAAQAIAGVMGQTLLLAWSGETFMLNAMPIWVRPVTVALSVSHANVL